MRIAKLMKLTRNTARTIMNMGLMMFVLCVFFMASQTFTGGLFSNLGSGNTVIAIVAGTILPLVPVSCLMMFLNFSKFWVL
jgi:uncharacterized membrane protein YjjP (DUF1212 family)